MYLLTAIVAGQSAENANREDSIYPMNLTDEVLVKKFKKYVRRLGYGVLREGKKKPSYEQQLIETLNDMLKAARAQKRRGSVFSLLTYSAERKREDSKDTLFNFWRLGFIGALHVLKWNDRRENPGGDTGDTITPPLTDEVITYYRKFRGYEALLYASDQKGYRDHFAHVLRVWMLGLVVIYELNDVSQMIPLALTGDSETDLRLFKEKERLAVFTVAALTHDMGYPLQKVAKVNTAVADMLKAFGGVNLEDLEVAFSAPHHQIAQDMLKLIASKPHYKGFSGTELTKEDRVKYVNAWAEAYDRCRKLKDYEGANKKHGRDWRLVLRCQWKYFQKYARALERNEHGFLSALLLQRKLLFFREGEFALEEDYTFALEEARQFLIRREILRAVATHTCPDIYFLSTVSVDALLFFCDEIQDWARPRFGDLYVGDIVGSKMDITLSSFDSRKVAWQIKMSSSSPEQLSYVVLGVGHTLYNRLRSAPDSKRRNFAVHWTCVAKIGRTQCKAAFRFNRLRQTFTLKVSPNRKPLDLMDSLDGILTGRKTYDSCREEISDKLEKIKL